jgi:hypothetical protein
VAFTLCCLGLCRILVLAQAVVDVMCDHVAAAHHRKQQQREGVSTS